VKVCKNSQGEQLHGGPRVGVHTGDAKGPFGVATHVHSHHPLWKSFLTTCLPIALIHIVVQYLPPSVSTLLS
jgi:hypothetical protein